MYIFDESIYGVYDVETHKLWSHISKDDLIQFKEGFLKGKYIIYRITPQTEMEFLVTLDNFTSFEEIEKQKDIIEKITKTIKDHYKEFWHHFALYTKLSKLLK